ncbi:MAG: hypothetical protein WC955_00670 [Elusimicrobiota bacterium]
MTDWFIPWVISVCPPIQNMDYAKLSSAIMFFKAVHTLPYFWLALFSTITVSYMFSLFIRTVWEKAVVSSAILGLVAFHAYRLTFDGGIVYLLLLILIFFLGRKVSEIDWSANRFDVLMRVLLFIPFFVELFIPSLLLYYCETVDNAVVKKVCVSAKKLKLVMLLSLIGANAVIFTLFMIKNEYSKIVPVYPEVQKLAPGNFYCLELDKQKERLYASKTEAKVLYSFDLRTEPCKYNKLVLLTLEFQDLRFNPERNELYHCDRLYERVTVVDSNTLKVKRVSESVVTGGGSARVAFDNASRTILATRENDDAWALSLDSLTPIRKFDNFGDRNECIVYDSKNKRYVLTYFEKYPYIRFVYPANWKVEEINVPMCQGGITISDELNELYLALPKNKKVYVYDLRTMKFKHRFNVTFGVRQLAYDNIHKLLFAPSAVSGYMDIIDVINKKLVRRVYAGYALREVCVYPEKHWVFISSKEDGVGRIQYQ